MQGLMSGLACNSIAVARKRRASVLAVSLLLTLVVMTLLTASLAWAQGPGSSISYIRGRVRFMPGATEQPVTVTLEDERGGTVARTQTDSRGRFIFNVHSQSIYVIKVRLAGHREVSRRVDLVSGIVTDVLIDLMPESGKDSSAAPLAVSEPTISVKRLAVPEAAQSEFEKGINLLLARKEPEASIPHFRKAIEVHPAFAEAYLLLGRAYMDLVRWKEAQLALEKAILQDDKLAGAHLALGACYNEQKDFAAAEKALLRGLELDAESAEGHYELGKTYWALGRWQEAEPHARRAVTLRPDFAPVHVLMGNILLRKRDAPAALQEFKEYLRLEPQGPFAASTRDMVARIEKALAAPR